MIEEAEIVWPSELENALVEAMLLYPHRTIKHADGKCYGRHKMISQYIGNKYGKFRSSRQISSHIQVLKQRKNKNYLTSFIQRSIVGPELKNGSSLDCMPLTLIDNRVILTEKELDLRSQFDFAQANNIINYLRLGIPERTVSSTKLSYLYDCTYSISSSHEKKSIFTIFTSATPSYIPEIKLSVIQPFFDSTLTDLFSSVPLNSFYLIYSWVNLDFDLESKLFFQETVFYSPLKMEIDNMFVNYLFGKKFSYKYEDNFTVSDIKVNDKNYYIYRTKSSFTDEIIQHLSDYSIMRNPIQIDYLKHIMSNFSGLKIVTVRDTMEVLMVIAKINHYDADSAGYQLFRIVP